MLNTQYLSNVKGVPCYSLGKVTEISGQRKYNVLIDYYFLSSHFKKVKLNLHSLNIDGVAFHSP